MERITLTEAEVRRFVDSLSVWGICPSWAAVAELAAISPCTYREFTDLLWRTEGLDPTMMDKHLYRDVLEVVRLHFQKLIDESPVESE